MQIEGARDGSTEKAALQGYPVVIELPVLWGDMDANAHVNNTVFFRYLESARIAYFQAIDWRRRTPDNPVGMILASTQCRFRRPLTYPDTIHVGARVAEIGHDRVVFQHEILSTKLGQVAAEGSAVVVCYDYEQGKKAKLPDDVRARIEALETGARGRS